MASDQAVDWHGGWPVVVVGGALVESLVWPMRVVVPRLLGQDPGGVVFVADQDAVGALAADGAHEPLGITVRPGSSRRCLGDRDVLAVEYGVEAGGELGVSVSDEETERADAIAQIHGQVASGLSDPLPRRVSGHPQDVHPTSAYFDHEQGVSGGAGRSCRGGRNRRPAAHRPDWQERPPGRVQLSGRGTIPWARKILRTVDSQAGSPDAGVRRALADIPTEDSLARVGKSARGSAVRRRAA